MTIDNSLDVVLPVLNEEHDLVLAVETPLSFLADNLQEYDWRIVIADNGSTDATLTICRERTHDVTYFLDPDRITNESPPKPVIDLTRPEILKRFRAGIGLPAKSNERV